MATPPPPELKDWFVSLSGHAVTSLFVQIFGSCDGCLIWFMSWLLVCIFLLKSATQLWCLEAPSMAFGMLRYTWTTMSNSYCCIHFPFRVTSPTSGVHFFPFTACLILQPDLIKTVKDLSHSDSTLLWVAFTNIFVFLDTICWRARRGVLLLFPGTPACRNGLPARWALWQAPNCMLMNPPARLPCQKDRQPGLC